MSVSTYSKIVVGITLQHLIKDVELKTTYFDEHDIKGKKTGVKCPETTIHYTLFNNKIVTKEYFDEMIEDVEDDLDLKYDPWQGRNECKPKDVVLGLEVYTASSNEGEGIQVVDPEVIEKKGEEFMSIIQQRIGYKGDWNIYFTTFSS